MTDVFICDAIRTPIGRYGGSLAGVRPDDLAGTVIASSEDSRNVGRMAALLAGLPLIVSGLTVNRLCASAMEAVGIAARSIRARNLNIAGGVESMSRAPFVMGKAETPFSRSCEIFDTTIGWRFVNPNEDDVWRGLNA